MINTFIYRNYENVDKNSLHSKIRVTPYELNVSDNDKYIHL